MPLRNLLILCTAMIVSLACYKQAVHNRFARMVGESLQIIQSEYVEEVEAEKLFEDAMKGMMSGLDDYSSFIPKSDYSQFQEVLTQEFGGIGIVVEASQQSKRLTVSSPVKDTPALAAGLRRGDTIYAIDGEDTEGMTLNDSVKLMRGPVGSKVELLVRRPGRDDLKRYQIERKRIPIESVLGDSRKLGGDWNFFLEEHPNIGYIRLTTFGELTTDELRAALRQYEEHPVDALILDVRNNAGGLLSTAVELCDMFIDGGKIVSTRGRGGQERNAYFATEQVELPVSLPMVVMMNGDSASASEILGACLQDHHRAAVVGERSYGKGTVQNLIELQAGQSALKLTTASYWRPSGQNIHRLKNDDEDKQWGVSPSAGLNVKLSDEEFEGVVRVRRERDVLLIGDEPELLEPPMESSRARDPQVDRAVEYLHEQLHEAEPAPAGQRAA